MLKLKDPLSRLHRGQKGFTLIELLVVIAILGAIAAVVVLNIGGFIGQGETEAAATELHNVQTAVVAFQAANAGALPTIALFPVAGEMDEYFMGGVAALNHSYTLEADGEVTQGAALP